MHEEVHKINFKAVGVNSKLSFEGFTALTTPEKTIITQEEANQVRISNSINEAVAYNITPLAFMLAGIIIIGFLYIGGKSE